MNTRAELAELLQRLQARGVQLSLGGSQGQDLRVQAPRGALDAELQQALKQHKAELISWLQQQAERSQRLPLTPTQQRLWFLQQLEPQSARYHEVLMLRILTPLTAEQLLASFQLLLPRHGALRASFHHAEGQLWQELAGPELSLSLSCSQGLADAEAIRAWIQAPFDLRQAPLLRLGLFQHPDGMQRLVLVCHHLIMDAWSAGLLLQACLQHWQASPGAEPLPKPAPAPELDYADYLLEQASAPKIAADPAFWQAAFAAVPLALKLPRQLPTADSELGIEHVPDRALSWEQPLPAGFEAMLTQACQALKVTRFAWILSAWQVFLSRHWRLPAFALALPSSSRQHAAQAQLIGCLIETLLWPARIDPQLSFAEQLQQVQAQLPDYLSRAQTPFESLVQTLNPPRELPFFPQLCLSVQDFLPAGAHQREGESDGLGYELETPPFVPAKFELLLNWLSFRESLQVVWPQGWYTLPAMQQLLAGFVHFCERALAAPQTRITELPDQTPAARGHLQSRWQATLAIPTEPLWIHQFVERQARLAPERPALRWAAQNFSYGWLNACANRMARALQALGLKPGARVAFVLEVQPELIVLLLAILKAGAVYLPLDPQSPASRQLAMLRDATPSLLITAELSTELSTELPDLTPLPLATLAAQAQGLSEANLELPLQAQDLAYLIYTSGSTGQPNGVPISHGNIARLFRACEQKMPFARDAVWLLYHSIAFDFSVWEIWGAFYGGSSLVLMPRAQARDPEQVWQLICQEQVTFLNQTPSAFRALSRVACRSELKPALQRLLLSGEALDPRSLAPWFDHFGQQVELINAYGITETTVLVSWHVLQPAESRSGASPIGGPLPDLGLCLLDAELQPVPDGLPGEICVWGPGLSPGYWQRPALTQQRFVQTPTQRLYRSGDLAVAQDGQLYYLQRRDQQVQLRGHRVECGEVQAALEALPKIEAAHVRLQTDPDKPSQLQAYVIPCHWPPPAETAEAALKAQLRDSLPAVMIPSRIWQVQAFPLNQNGKLDPVALARLAEPPTAAHPTAAFSASTPAASQYEAQLAQILGDLLGRPAAELSPDANLFDLGAHSLLLVEARERILTATGQELALLDIFQHPSLRQLAEFLTQQAGPGASPMPDRPAAQSAGWGQALPGKASGQIAIIGLGLRLPGASSPEQFWQNLTAGVESILRWSPAELAAAGVPAAEYTAPEYVPASGWCEGVTDFAASYFGISPAEARLLDPQQRLMLELALETLERAGYGDHSQPQPIGVFASAGISRYLLEQLLQAGGLPEDLNPMQILLAHDKDYLASRVAYKLDLTGPALMVQSACSSSLLAVHMACESLRQGACELALAGGVNLDLRAQGYRWQAGSIYSRDGHCRPFDASADGIVGGSGGAWVLLKPLAAAERDRDTVYAVIEASAVNNDGARKAGFLAPGLAGQQAVIQQALQRAGVAPQALGYLEAHGTGTRLGDPIEVRALSRAWQEAQPDLPQQFCALGSVKGNLGHLDAAAGVASLIKVALMLHHRRKVASLNVRQLNPELQLEQSPFYLARNEAWEAPQPYAGVSALGVGGTNVHMICSAAPQPPAHHTAPPQQADVLLPLSAPSEASLQALAQALLQDPALQQTAQMQSELQLESHSGSLKLNDWALSLQRGRKAGSWRAFVLAQQHTELRQALEQIAAPQPGRSRQQALTRPGPLYWLCPGLGSQSAGLASLFQNLPAFREALEQGVEGLKPHWPHDIKALLLAEAEPEALQAPELMQPLIFVSGWALAQAWKALGLQPAGLIGHSFGEYLAACLGGMCSFPEMLQLVQVRARIFARLQQTAPAEAPGAVMTVACGPAELPPLPAGVVLASQNGRQRLTLSGPRPALEALATQLTQPSRFLPIPHLVHHPELAGLLDQLRQAATAIAWQAPHLPVWSCLHGRWHTQAPSPQDWVQQTLASFDFTPALQALPESAALLELSLNPQLSPLFRSSDAWLPNPSPAHTNAWKRWLQQAGALWQRGYALRWEALPTSSPGRRIPLPPTPLMRQRYGLERLSLSPSQSSAKRAEAATRPTGLQRQPVSQWLAYLSWQRQPRLQPLKPGTDLPEPQWLDWHQPLPAQLASELWLALRPPESLELDWMLAQTEALRQLALALQARHWQGRLCLLTPALQVVTGTETTAPLLAICVGLFQSLAAEAPHWQLRWIESDDLTCWRLEAGQPEPQVAWRHGQRWLPHWQNLPARPAAGPDSPLKSQGVYLITGAAGGLGQALTQWLRQEFQARLVLVSRRDLSSDSLKHSAETLCWQGDVSQALTLEQALQAAIKRFGRVDGIFHAAGLAEAVPLSQLRPETFWHLLAAKVQGALQLQWALAQLPCQPDFVLLCSAPAGRVAAPAQAAYIAANLFLDALAQQQGPGWISVQWGPWREAGLAQRLLQNLPSAWQPAYAEYLAQGFSNSEGCEALAACLQQAQSLMAASPLSVPSLQNWQTRWQQLAANAEAQPLAPELELDLATGSLLQRLQRIWAHCLGLQPEPSSRFSELGGDSLMALQMKAMAEQALGQSIHLNLLLADLPLQELAQALEQTAEVSPVTAANSADQADKTALAQLLVPLQRSSAPQAGPPLFFVHAISGTVFPFLALAQALPTAFYGLQSQGLTQGSPQHTLSAMAASYAQAIAQQQTPPYRIGGWSFGALVAFEMARQWQAAGVPVAELILLDMQAPDLDGQLDLDPVGLRVRFEADLAALGTQVLPDPAFREQLYAIFEAHVAASATFVPQLLNLPATLLVAKQGFGASHPEADLGWGRWLPQLQCHTIPGDHYTCLEPEQLQHWVHLLRAC